MSMYEFGPFQLDEAHLLLLERGVPVPIGPKVVATLLALLEHPGEVFPKGDLMARVWPEGYVDEANLAQNVYVLRKTLRMSWNARAIETIPRRGYRFAAPVRRHEEITRSQRRVLLAPHPFRQAAVFAAAFALAVLGGLVVTSGKLPGRVAPRAVAQDTRLYVIGRYYWNLRTPDGLAKSVEYFRRIVRNDPRDARGYAGLASANAIMAQYGYGPVSQGIELARARAYAREALAMDPNNGDAYAVLGLMSSGTMNGGVAHLAAALVDLRRAITLDPSSGTAHEWYGVALLQQGRVGEAYSELGEAAELDPLSVSATAWLGMTAYLERHYRDAVSYARETLDLSPQRTDAYEVLGLAYEALGDEPRAGQSFRRLAGACTTCHAEAAALLAGLYAHANQMSRARAELAIAQERGAMVGPEDLAAALDAVGQRNAAIARLRRWQNDSGYAAAEIANDPRFAGLRKISKLRGTS